MAGSQGSPGRQFAAAWQAATAALGEWGQQVAAATTEAAGKLDPAVRSAFEAAVEAAKAAFAGNWGACQCPCATAHPQDKDVCDHSAVLTRRIRETDMPLCAPCAVAQGVAEMPR
jgi:hypothetical protein